MFLCKIKEGSKDIRNGIVPDEGQIGVEWLELSELLNYKLYPKSMREYIIDYIACKELPVSLGDIN